MEFGRKTQDEFIFTIDDRGSFSISLPPADPRKRDLDQVLPAVFKTIWEITRVGNSIAHLDCVDIETNVVQLYARALCNPRCNVTTIRFADGWLRDKFSVEDELKIKKFGLLKVSSLLAPLKDDHCKVTTIKFENRLFRRQELLMISNILSNPDRKVAQIDFVECHVMGTQPGEQHEFTSALVDQGILRISVAATAPNRTEIIADLVETAASAGIKDDSATLWEINLSGNEITDTGPVVALIRGRTQGSNISINLSNNRINAAGATEILRALETPDCKVSSINLEYNDNIPQPLLEQIDAAGQANQFLLK